MRRPGLPFSLSSVLLPSLLLPVAFVAPGCGGDDQNGVVSCTEEASGYATVILPEVVGLYCLDCHARDRAGAARSNAPLGVDFDTWERAAPHAEALADAITSGRMPPGGRPRPDAVARERVERWRRCGFPE